MKKIYLPAMAILFILLGVNQSAIAAKGNWMCFCEDEESVVIAGVDKETAFAYRAYHIDNTGHEHIHCFPDD